MNSISVRCWTCQRVTELGAAAASSEPMQACCFFTLASVHKAFNAALLNQAKMQRGQGERLANFADALTNAMITSDSKMLRAAAVRMRNVTSKKSSDR